MRPSLFNARFKALSDRSGDRSAGGRRFHVAGPLTAKLSCPVAVETCESEISVRIESRIESAATIRDVVDVKVVECVGAVHRETPTGDISPHISPLVRWGKDYGPGLKISHLMGRRGSGTPVSASLKKNPPPRALVRVRNSPCGSIRVKLRVRVSASGEEGNLHPCRPPCEYFSEYTSRGKPKIPPADRIRIDLGHKARKNPFDNADLGSQAVGMVLHIMQLNVEGLSAAFFEEVQVFKFSVER